MGVYNGGTNWTKVAKSGVHDSFTGTWETGKTNILQKNGIKIPSEYAMHSRESRQMSCVDASMNSRGAWMDSFPTHQLGGWLMKVCKYSSISIQFRGFHHRDGISTVFLTGSQLLYTRLLEIVQNTCLQTPD
jgi:hypothetical protein